jgi:predicted AlkP superfamily pyrophosphatase or phosphodiesterase
LSVFPDRFLLDAAMRLRLPIIICFALLLAGCSRPTASIVIAPDPGRPKLLVLIVFDQLRGDYLARWADLYPEGGFKRLMNEGLWFTDCHYPYACTMTGPGHASLLTGCSPDRHGIVMNDWFDRSIGKTVYCATTDRYSRVFTCPPPLPDPKDKESNKGGTPERMTADGVADWLKDQTGGKSKVVALSLKDRSAVLPGGKRADACYWFDSRTGTFVTSTWYRDRCHDWVYAFNDRRPADAWFGKQWTKLRPDIDYEKYSGPDEVTSETPGISKKMGRSFPHPLSINKPKPDKEYYDEVTCSRFGNDLLLDFAQTAFDAMKLGQGPQTDLFSISFSANDIVGHSFGPDSQEVLDITLNADRCVAKMLQLLDAKVGAGKYLVALTADHGICPIPQPDKRLKPADLRKQAEEFLDIKYGKVENEKSKWIDSEAFPWVYLNYRKLAARKLDPKVVAAELVKWVKEQPWALNAYTRAEVEAVNEDSDHIARSMKKAYYADRCGDLGFVLKPYYLSTDYETGTTHGSPHSYDTHVPLVFFGTGMPVQKCADQVTPQAIAAVFARAAGLKPAKTLDAPVPNLCINGAKP